MLEAGLVALMAPLGKLPDGACAVRAEERVSEPRGRGIPSAAVAAVAAWSHATAIFDRIGVDFLTTPFQPIPVSRAGCPAP